MEAALNTPPRTKPTTRQNGLKSAKLAWVTGASSGIGRSVALKLAKDGWRVIASARNTNALEELAAEATGRIFVFSLDVTGKDDVNAAVSAIETAHGPIDLAFFCAGTYRRDSADSFDVDALGEMMALNVMGTANCLAAIMPLMTGRKSGQIAVTSSVAGYTGLPGGGSYGATKAALINLCEALYPELAAHNVRLSLINPGFVDTPLSQKNDFAMPFLISADEAADAIVRGLEKDRFEIIFPWKMAVAIKLLHMLPYPLIFALTRRMLRS